MTKGTMATTLRWMAAALIAAGLLASAPALAQPQPPPGFAIVNFTKHVPVVKDIVITAGQTVRFDVDARNYAHVSLLIAGDTQPDAAPITLVTHFGPPQVPSGPPRPLTTDANGHIAMSFRDPVLGPAMVVAIHNDSAADLHLSIGAYLSN